MIEPDLDAAQAGELIRAAAAEVRAPDVLRARIAQAQARAAAKDAREDAREPRRERRKGRRARRFRTSL